MQVVPTKAIAKVAIIFEPNGNGKVIYMAHAPAAIFRASFDVLTRTSALL